MNNDRTNDDGDVVAIRGSVEIPDNVDSSKSGRIIIESDKPARNIIGNDSFLKRFVKTSSIGVNCEKLVRKIRRSPKVIRKKLFSSRSSESSDIVADNLEDDYGKPRVPIRRNKTRFSSKRQEETRGGAYPRIEDEKKRAFQLEEQYASSRSVSIEDVEELIRSEDNSRLIEARAFIVKENRRASRRNDHLNPPNTKTLARNEARLLQVPRNDYFDDDSSEESCPETDTILHQSRLHKRRNRPDSLKVENPWQGPDSRENPSPRIDKFKYSPPPDEVNPAIDLDENLKKLIENHSSPLQGNVKSPRSLVRRHRSTATSVCQGSSDNRVPSDNSDEEQHKERRASLPTNLIDWGAYSTCTEDSVKRSDVIKAGRRLDEQQQSVETAEFAKCRIALFTPNATKAERGVNCSVLLTQQQLGKSDVIKQSTSSTKTPTRTARSANIWNSSKPEVRDKLIGSSHIAQTFFAPHEMLSPVNSPESVEAIRGNKKHEENNDEIIIESSCEKRLEPKDIEENYFIHLEAALPPKNPIKLTSLANNRHPPNPHRQDPPNNVERKVNYKNEAQNGCSQERASTWSSIEPCDEISLNCQVTSTSTRGKSEFVVTGPSDDDRDVEKQTSLSRAEVNEKSLSKVPNPSKSLRPGEPEQRSKSSGSFRSLKKSFRTNNQRRVSKARVKVESKMKLVFRLMRIREKLIFGISAFAILFTLLLVMDLQMDLGYSGHHLVPSHGRVRMGDSPNRESVYNNFRHKFVHRPNASKEILTGNDVSTMIPNSNRENINKNVPIDRRTVKTDKPEVHDDFSDLMDYVINGDGVNPETGVIRISGEDYTDNPTLASLKRTSVR